jgi:hypothetical protein
MKRTFLFLKAVAQAPYSPQAEKIISAVGRDIAEVSLKFISWSAMIGALQFAEIKSGNQHLWLFKLLLSKLSMGVYLLQYHENRDSVI